MATVKAALIPFRFHGTYRSFPSSSTEYTTLVKTKTILIDINHPAHVHLFRYLITNLRQRGHHVLVAAKNSQAITVLLKEYSIPFISTGVKKDSIYLKYFFELWHLLKLYILVLIKGVDVGIGISVALPIIGKITRMQTIVLDDDDLAVTPKSGKLISLADIILTPSALAHENRGMNHKCHSSFHELAYLHPNQFKPDPTVLSRAGLTEGEPFFILRFNAFKAHHDEGAYGLSSDRRRQLVELLKPLGRILITSERAIEPEFDKYRIPVPASQMHSLMHYATLFIGDSQTMTTEAALLGTPAVKLNTFAGILSIPNELEQRYELCYAYRPDQFNLFLDKIQFLLQLPDIKILWQKRLNRLLADKIDLSAYLMELIEA